MNNNTLGKKVPVTLRRKERERLQRQRHILKTAEKVFAKKGYQGATIQEIATEAELAVGTIYNFFASKDALYSEIITSRLDEMHETVLSKIDPIHDPKDQLKEMLLSQAAFIEKNRNFFIIFFRDQNRFPLSLKTAFGQEVFARYQRYLETLKNIFTQGIRQEVFKPFDPEDLAEAWGGLCNTFFFKWLTEKPDWTLNSKAMTLYELFIHGVEHETR